MKAIIIAAALTVAFAASAQARGYFFNDARAHPASHGGTHRDSGSSHKGHRHK